MTGRIITSLLLCAGLCAPAVLAKPATAPATAPSASAKRATTQKSDKFPTPAEIVERMKKVKEQQEKLLKVAYFDLSEQVVEKPADFSWFGDASATTLRSLISRLHQARDDKDIRAVLLTLGTAEMNLSQAQEVRDALVQLRRAGKETFVYADSYDTTSYTIASGATNVCLLQGGQIDIPGVGLETTFYRGLMDKVGVKADYVQIGEYKGYEEPYTRTAPTEELRGELNKLVESLYNQIVDDVSLNRNLPKETVRQVIDDAILTAEQAKTRGLVDHLVDQDGLRKLVTSELGQEINLLHDYGKPQRKEIDFSNPMAFFQIFMRKPEQVTKPTIAVVYADGEIVDGEGGEGLLGGGGVGSEELRRAFREAARDTNCKAIVIRIDSPGGSALASEVMWQAARRAAAEKPVIVSVGSMAASGGYYLASAGDYIFADSTAIVGSIGVAGGKIVLKDLFDKLGITSESFTRGRNADLYSSMQPFTERQRRMVVNSMKQTYDVFTQRVMTTRAGKIKDIDRVARGRIFLARQAKDLGMVDEIGGVEDAIAYAARKVSLKAGQYEVQTVPAPRTLADFFGGGGAQTRALPIHPQVSVAPDSILRAMSPAARRVLGQQLQFFRLLQERPVVLMAPYAITVK